MTIEAAQPGGDYTVMGTGPYAILWPYVSGAVRVAAVLAGVRTDLVAGVDFTVSPAASTTTGDVTLSAGAAATYAGGQIYLSRETAVEQGWLGVLGDREKGLEAQLDILAMRNQEQDQLLTGALRADIPLNPVVPVANAVIMFGPDLHPMVGPTAQDIADAQANADAAQADRIAADAAAAAAALSAANIDVTRAGNQTFTGINQFDNILRMKDGKALKFGTDDDAYAYFDNALNKLLRGGLPGVLLTEAFDTVEFRNVALALLFKAVSGGAFEAYHNGSKKLETQSTGAKVTGAMSADTAAGNWLASSLEAAAAVLGTKILTPLTALDFFNARFTINLGADGYFGIIFPTLTFRFQWKTFSLGAAAGANVTVPWPTPFGNFVIGSVVSCNGAAAQMIGIGAQDRFNCNLVKGGGDTSAHTGIVFGWGY